MLKAEHIIAEDEFVTHIMQEASFNDTIGKIEDAVDSSYPHNERVIFPPYFFFYVYFMTTHSSAYIRSGDLGRREELEVEKEKERRDGEGGRA
jgi:hypothetical protein